MVTGKKITGKMVPAVEGAMQTPSIASIDTVPAVTVVVHSATSQLECTAVIETGASISLLDESLSADLGLNTADAIETMLIDGDVPHITHLYSLDLELIDSGGRESLHFDGAPVLVHDLHRPVLLLGRRGMLEWLRIEMDFPAGTIALLRCEGPNDRYPTLTEELPGFDRILEDIGSHRTAQGIVLLAMELERYTDDFLLSREELRDETRDKPLSRMSLRDKLLIACRAVSTPSLLGQVEELVQMRNAAAHGYHIVEAGSGQRFLQAAEALLSHLAEERRKHQR